MIEFEEAMKSINEAVLAKHLCVVVGECVVDYVGRASSKLDKGTRLILLKGDGSISVHQNKLVRPINYMIKTKISTEIIGNTIELTAKHVNPRETLQILFYKINDVLVYDLGRNQDIRLSGSEAHLRDQLMESLSFIEPGLKPVNKEQFFRKGIADIIAEDNSGRLVIIELKRRQADYASVTQLKRYMEQVQNMKGIQTRGILLAPSIGKNAKELLDKHGLEFRKLEFKLYPNEERAEIKGLEKQQQKLF